ncbi:unnamed protein product, partial [marine sediment metagenome]
TADHLVSGGGGIDPLGEGLQGDVHQHAYPIRRILIHCPFGVNVNCLEDILSLERILSIYLNYRVILVHVIPVSG